MDNIAEKECIVKQAVESSSFLEFYLWATSGCHRVFLSYCHLISIVPYPVNCEFCCLAVWHVVPSKMDDISLYDQPTACEDHMAG